MTVTVPVASHIVHLIQRRERRLELQVRRLHLVRSVPCTTKGSDLERNTREQRAAQKCPNHIDLGPAEVIRRLTIGRPSSYFVVQHFPENRRDTFGVMHVRRKDHTPIKLYDLRGLAIIRRASIYVEDRASWLAGKEYIGELYVPPPPVWEMPLYGGMAMSLGFGPSVTSRARDLGYRMGFQTARIIAGLPAVDEVEPVLSAPTEQGQEQGERENETSSTKAVVAPMAMTRDAWRSQADAQYRVQTVGTAGVAGLRQFSSLEGTSAC